MKLNILLYLSVLILITSITTLRAQENSENELVLITNVDIFDGKSDNLQTGMSVLINGNKISKISKSISAPKGATVIDAKGNTLTPGLIDAHVHLAWNLGVGGMFNSPSDYIAALALDEAKATLMRGYTSIRDVSGSVFGVKRAIDQGLFVGPRIWGSGSGISMTAGHGDMRTPGTPPRQMGGPDQTDVERLGLSIFADGVSEVTAASRMQLRNGSNLLKMYVGGAVSGVYDPLDIVEFSFDEIKAAADEAKRWNTYLAIHAYTDQAIQQALKAGAMSIEHATLISEETAKLIAEKGAFLSTQTGVYLSEAPADWSEAQKAKQKAAKDGLDTMFKLAKKYNLNIAFGTDLVGSKTIKDNQKYELSNRLKWFTPVEILKQATASNAKLLSWSGPRNPYPGKLGVIEEGVLADVLIVKGNPLENLKLFENPEENLLMIMKDGRIFKNIIK